MDSSKSSLAYQIMKKLIFENKWTPGQKFSILEVASKLKISRTPVSEAVKLLASEGFVKILPYKGFEIGCYSILELKELLEIKTVLGGLAAYKAAENSEAKKKAILTEMLEEQRKWMQINDTEHAWKCDKSLHFAIFTLSASPKLERLATALWHQIHYYNELFINSQELSEIFQEHVELVAAIINSNPHEARRISENHDARYMKNLLSKTEQLTSNDFKNLKLNISIEELLLSNVMSLDMISPEDETDECSSESRR
jgi:Transcriptional regulators